MYVHVRERSVCVTKILEGTNYAGTNHFQRHNRACRASKPVEISTSSKFERAGRGKFRFFAPLATQMTVQSPLFQFIHSNRKAASIKAAVKRLAFAYLRSQHEATFVITIARVQSLSAALVLLQQRRNEQQRRRSAAGHALSPNLSGGRWPCADGTVRR